MSRKEKRNPLFSVIVITKNEELNIGECLKSIVEVFESFGYSYEIVMVDSNSEDNTIKKALELNINNLKVVKIVNSTIYTAALGRNIGSKCSRGKYLLFLDGDMKLYRDFIVKGLDRLKESNCAGLIGIRDDIIVNSQRKTIKILKNKYNIQREGIAPHFGGAVLLKKEILNMVGGYKGHIISFEEPELYIRLKSKGYVIYNIPYKMVDHYIEPEGKVDKILSLVFSKRALGLGQVIRTCFSTTTFKYLIAHRPIIQILAPVVFDLISIIFLILSPLNTLLSFGVLFAQLMSLIICLTFFDIKKFLLSKLLLFPTLFGLLYQKKVEYKLEVIK